ncbi:MAG: hypothetical protein AABX04_01880 [Nanoarchaeota archaeon]
MGDLYQKLVLAAVGVVVAGGLWVGVNLEITHSRLASLNGRARYWSGEVSKLEGVKDRYSGRCAVPSHPGNCIDRAAFEGKFPINSSNERLNQISDQYCDGYTTKVKDFVASVNSKLYATKPNVERLY